MALPQPNPGETQEAFIGRFMADENARGQYPLPVNREAMAYQVYQHRQRYSASAPAAAPAQYPLPSRYRGG